MANYQSPWCWQRTAVAPREKERRGDLQTILLTPPFLTIHHQFLPTNSAGYRALWGRFVFLFIMLVLLRQNESKLYYGVHGDWVPKVSAAAHYETIEDALLANRHAHLQGTEIVVLHSNGRHKVVLPVGKESWTGRDWHTPGTAVHSRTQNPGSSGTLIPRASHTARRPNSKGGREQELANHRER